MHRALQRCVWYCAAVEHTINGHALVRVPSCVMLIGAHRTVMRGSGREAPALESLSAFRWAAPRSAFALRF